MKCPHCKKEIGVILSPRGKDIEQYVSGLQQQLGEMHIKYDKLLNLLATIVKDEEYEFGLDEET